MKKISDLFAALFTAASCLTSCFYWSPNGYEPRSAERAAYNYVQNSNQPLTDMLFTAYLSHRYFALSTDADRKTFMDTYFPECQIYDTLKADGTRNWRLERRKADYHFDHFLFSETPQGLLRATLLGAHQSTEINTKYQFTVRQGADGHWTLTDYAAVIRNDYSDRGYGRLAFDISSKQLDVVWTQPKNDSLYCELTGTIQMASAETPSLLIAAEIQEPLRARVGKDHFAVVSYPWVKGRLSLAVTDGGTHQTDYVSVVLSGNDDGQALVEMKK